MTGDLVLKFLHFCSSLYLTFIVNGNPTNKFIQQLWEISVFAQIDGEMKFEIFKTCVVADVVAQIHYRKLKIKKSTARKNLATNMYMEDFVNFNLCFRFPFCVDISCEYNPSFIFLLI